MNQATHQLPPLIPLARLLEQRRITTTDQAAQVEFDVTQDWLQGGTAFGGLVGKKCPPGSGDGAGSWRPWLIRLSLCTAEQKSVVKA